MNGAEPVLPETCRLFSREGVRHGIDERCTFPVYGLAEATLAVTFPTPGTGLEFDRVDKAALERGMAIPSDDSKAHELTFLGGAVDGMEVRVVAQGSDGCSDREIGEIEIRGSSLTSGYVGCPQLPQGSWLGTGDLGYMVNEDLVVCGRSKDLIIVAGRNIFPTDIEQAVSAIPGIWRGQVAAFSIEDKGRERVVVIAETDSTSRISLIREFEEGRVGGRRGYRRRRPSDRPRHHCQDNVGKNLQKRM